AQKPVVFADLLEWSGLKRATLEMIVNDLYRDGSINCAGITRDGKTSVMVWETGTVKKTPSYWRDYPIKRAR
ncbi:MAG: hypothetical protein AB1513_11995, partial [Pseudomonadota bacterium]